MIDVVIYGFIFKVNSEKLLNVLLVNILYRESRLLLFIIFCIILVFMFGIGIVVFILNIMIIISVYIIFFFIVLIF